MSGDAMRDVQCCIAGGGPAGIMLGYLMARAGVRTLVLEKHADFLRDFRGDTIHPSTLQVMHELGLLPAFLKLPHQELQQLSGNFGGTSVRIADFSRLDTTCRFISLMPQWDFLNFLAAEAARLPAFSLIMRGEATDLLVAGGRVVGLRATTQDGPLTVHAALTVAADGRHSVLRARANLPLREIGAPIDVLWFRVARAATADRSLGRFGRGSIVVTLDRGDYWQCAYVIAKGEIDGVRAKGLPAFREEVARTAPVLRAHIGDIRSWDDVKLLSVAVDRLERWDKPGLLCIGDAAHAMSPVGGVGINLAIQDAVATANLLAAKLAAGSLTDTDVAGVQRRRMFPTRVTQAIQIMAQERVLKPVISGANRDLRPPLAMRLLTRSPWLQGLVARVVGLGVRPEHVSSPAVGR